MSLEPIQAGQSINKPHPPFTLDATFRDDTFAETFQKAIQDVDIIQKQADQAVIDLTTGRKQDLHQTMISIERADTAFQLMMQVRNKIVSAYEEVSRMQI